MTMVDLTGIPIISAMPKLAQFGGLLTPSLGGAVQRIDRAGTRWAWDFTTAAMLVEPDGRKWAAKLVEAARIGAVMPIIQPGLSVIAPGNAITVSATTTSGHSVPITGATANYPVRAGQWVSIVSGGYRYSDMIRTATAVATDGTATLDLQNLIRTPLSVGDVVELAQPKVEGFLTSDIGWPLEISRATVFSFTIEEAA